MKSIENESRLEVNGLEIALRTADNRDIGFVYELMRTGLEDYFEQTPEGWKRSKFKERYSPERIRILEHNSMPIGFFDLEESKASAYVHNLHLTRDYQGRGIGSRILRLIEKRAKLGGLKCIKAKVFKNNLRILSIVLSRFGYRIKKDLEKENSFLVVKDLEEKR